MLGSLIDGRYRVVAEIGRGAMGVVYEAWQEDLRRRVAVKVLAPAWAQDEQAIARFQREARAASAIGHANIVFVYDMGRLADGRPFLVMEHLEGVSLSALIRDQAPLPPERVCEIVDGIAAALDAIHERRFVHRDIKPENVLLVRQSNGGERIVLLDFGLAALATPQARSIRFSGEGTIHGTPHYMCPEAATGDLPDRTGDVYSLGVVAFEMLTGHLPFDGLNAQSLLVQHVAKPAPTLRERAGRDFAPELEVAIAFALAKLPSQRPPTAGVFARTLRTAVERGTTIPTPPPRPTPTPPRRRLSSLITSISTFLGLQPTAD